MANNLKHQVHGECEEQQKDLECQGLSIKPCSTPILRSQGDKKEPRMRIEKKQQPERLDKNLKYVFYLEAKLRNCAQWEKVNSCIRYSWSVS